MIRDDINTILVYRLSLSIILFNYLLKPIKNPVLIIIKFIKKYPVIERTFPKEYTVANLVGLPAIAAINAVKLIIYKKYPYLIKNYHYYLLQNK